MKKLVRATLLVLLALLAGCAPTTGNGPGSPGTSSAPSSAAESSAEELVTVPDVSGMNHQQAQDVMQAAGLYNLREADGTGQHRSLIIDRDWVQVAQDPPAGARVPKHTVVTLTAVKYTDR